MISPQAKKDYNYVRFFAILRDPDTPYLFACVMFKHVELMRKAAFRIMSKTYGAKKKDSGEPIYDAYPLKKLAQTLCFEDIDEARAACEHYNITIKEMKVRSSSSPGQSGLAEIVFWRHSDFKEPKDPDKGTMIPCRPKKMMKYIESKLKGATRLGVCRGEVSGEGASLSSPPLRRSPAVPSASSRPMPSSSQPSMPQSTATDQDAQTDELFKRQQELFRQQQAEAEKAKAKEAKEKRQRQKEEHERQEALKKEQEQAAAARKVAEEARREKESEEKRKEQEAARRAAEEEARRQNELEEQRRREAEEAARKLAEEQARKQRDLEEKRKREEEEKRQAQIRAEQERKRREEEERLRKEEERKRLEALRRQEEERRCREAEALKKAQEIQQRVDNARKILILRRWREKLPWKLRAQKHTAYSLGRIDPTFSKSTLFNENPVERGLHEILSPAESSADYAVIDTRRVLNRILAKSIDKLDVSSMMLDALCDDIEFLQHVKSGGLGSTGGETRNTTTILLKVAVLLPEPEGLEEQSMYELIHTWLHRRLGYGTVHMLQRQSVDGSHTYNARILLSKLDTWSGQMDCDAALVAIPPSFCNGDWDNTRKIEAIASAFACLDEDTPRTMYVFGEESSPEYFQDANEFLASCLPEVCEFPVVFPSAVAEKALDGCLHSALKTLVGKFVKEAFPPLVEQVSVMKLAASCIRDTLWRNAGICSLEVSRACLTALAKALDETRLSVEAWSGWPAEDFAGEGGLVRNYFGKNLHLPSVWTSSVFLDAAKTKITDLCQVFQVSVPQAVYKLVRSAPANIQDECEEMLHARQYRKCIQHALQWGGLPDEIFYLPKGTADSIAKEAIESVLGTNGKNVRYPPLVTGDDSYEDENVENEDPNNEDNPPRTPEKAGQNARTDRDNSCFHKPQDIFAESRTVSPVAPPMMTTPTPGMVSPPATGTGVYESPPAGVMSNKRSWAGMAAADDEDENDDGRGGAFSPASATKRFRKATSQPVQPRSRNLTESSAFTKKLQALLNGESTVDMDVGGTTLARLLRDAPPINEVDLER